MKDNNDSQLFNRRSAVKTAIFGATAALPCNLFGNEILMHVQDNIKTDKECIMEAGLTDEEAVCWEKTAAAAGAFFQLPELHPEDRKEIATAIHVIQNKLLGRPTYRKYLKIAKANHELKQAESKR